MAVTHTHAKYHSEQQFVQQLQWKQATALPNPLMLADTFACKTTILIVNIWGPLNFSSLSSLTAANSALSNLMDNTTAKAAERLKIDTACKDKQMPQADVF